MAELSRRPYLLRAMHEWMVDSGHTPHVIVDAVQEGVQVPAQFVTDGKIVLNLSPSATQGLAIGASLIEFNARFSGVVHHIRIPLPAVLGIYARETGEGMVFQEEGGAAPGPEAPDDGPAPGGGPGNGPAGGAAKKGEAAAARRPALKIVK